MDCEDAGVLEAAPPKKPPLLAGLSAGVAGLAPKRFDDPAVCPAPPPNRFDVLPAAGAGAAGVVEPNSDFGGCEAAGAPPPNRPPLAAGAFEAGGGAAGVVEPRFPKLKFVVFGAAGVVDGCELPPPNRPPGAGAVLPPPPPNSPPVGALEAGVLFSSSFFAPNSPPLPPSVAPPPEPPNRPPPPPAPDVAVLPNEKVGLLVDDALFDVLPKSPPPLPGVLPVDAPNALPAAGLLPPPNNPPPDCWLLGVLEPKRPPPEFDVAPKGEAVLPDEAGVPPKLNAMTARGHSRRRTCLIDLSANFNDCKQAIYLVR